MRSLLSLSVERLRVMVRIDGVDVSRADDNDGVDPWHVLVPVNRFVATDEPTSTLIACCSSCGPDCYAVEARICPDKSAAAVRAVLAGPAPRWPAEWHAIKTDREAPPAYAGPSWRRLDLS